MRTCRCSECRDPKADLAAGTVEWFRFYGNGCANCGFYSPTNADESLGYCLKFQLLARGAALELSRRRRGRLRKGGLPLLVGGAFSCREFQPFHNALGRQPHFLPSS